MRMSPVEQQRAAKLRSGSMTSWEDGRAERDALDELDRLSEEVSKAWRSDKSALEILREDREERQRTLEGGGEDDLV